MKQGDMVTEILILELLEYWYIWEIIVIILISEIWI